MKYITQDGISVINLEDTDERSLSYHGYALKKIMENQIVLMNKLLQIQEIIGRKGEVE